MTSTLTKALILRDLTSLPSSLCVPLRSSLEWAGESISGSINYDVRLSHFGRDLFNAYLGFNLPRVCYSISLFGDRHNLIAVSRRARLGLS